MKFSIKIEFDGNKVIGFVPKLSACYVQAAKIQDIAALMKMAIGIYKDNYESRREPFSPEIERPKINHKIKFQTISANQLANILRRFSYKNEFANNYFILFRKTVFPFDRIILPNTNDISPLIIRKLFGVDNVTVIRSEKNNFRISDQA